MAVQTKSIPMNENLARIDALLDEHSNEMYSTMLLFQGNINIFTLIIIRLKDLDRCHSSSYQSAR